MSRLEELKQRVLYPEGEFPSPYDLGELLRLYEAEIARLLSACAKADVEIDCANEELLKASRAIAEKDKALREIVPVLFGIAKVDMQSRDDAGKLKELAEWRLEAKRVIRAAALTPPGSS